jgi:hypothetical protein
LRWIHCTSNQGFDDDGIVADCSISRLSDDSQAPTLGWRYIYYIQIPIFFAHIPLIYFALPETRHNIILERKARRLNKEDNTDRYVSVHATEKKQLKASLKTSLTRPIRFLFFEPIVSFAAYWNGYLVSRLINPLIAIPKWR